MVVDATGRVKFANDAVKRALEPLGPDASPGAFFPGDMDSILAHLRRREPADFRREVKVGNRVFEEHIWVRLDPDAALINARDITEQKQAKEKVRELAALLQAFVDSPPDTEVFALDRDCRYTAFNAAHQRGMKEKYGVAIAAGMNMLDLIDEPEVKAKTQRSIDRALAGKSFTDVEVLPDLGTWHEFNWNPIRGINGEVEGVTAFIQDIARRKRVETALAESELKYRRMFESSNDAIMLLDNDRFFDCNPATLKVFGYSNRDEFLGKHPAEVSPPHQPDGRESRGAADEKIATALRVGRNYFEWLHQRADGTVFPADVLLTPMDFRGQKVLQATVRDISDRKRVEAALHESEERYRRIVESNAVGIVAVNPSFRFTSANRRFCEMVGYTEEELKCMTFPDITHPDNVAQDRASVAEVLAGKRPYYRTEKRYIRHDGKEVHAETTVFPVGAVAEHPRHTLALVEDITERRQAEQRVQTERDQLRRILDAMPDGAYVVGQDCGLQYVNPALLARGGPVDGRKCFDYFHGRTEPCPDCTHPQFFAGGTARHVYTTKIGITYDIQDVPVTGNDGRPARLVFLRDITERKQAEERDRQHLEDTNLLRDTAIGFVALDRHADIHRFIAERLARLAGEAYVVVNSYDPTRDEFRVEAVEGIGESAEAVLKLLGRHPVGITFRLAPDELRDYSSSTLMKIEGGLAALSFGKLPGAVRTAIESVFGLGDIYAMSFYWQEKILGTVNIIMHKGIPLRDPAVVEAFVNQAAIAIQHRRDADELEQHREHLAELVRERTAELEVANRELEAFSYSVSHDLRAPLRAIDGFAQAIVDDCGPQLDAKARGHLDRVSAAAGRMAELIDDLLNLARITRLPLERKPVDLSEIARDIVDKLSRTAPDRKVEFVIPDGLTAPADPVLVSMVLQNLLSNAWKFTSRHTSARIEFGVSSTAGEQVWFVRDDGAGFDMTYVEKLFQPFQRLHTERDFAGSGIGLAIVQRVVRRHGGRAWIEGEVEKGATCRFTLEPAPREG